MNNNIKKISFSSMLIALAFALSKVKIVPMPLGGSVTLFSMLAISLPGYLFGAKYGFVSAFIFSLLKLVFAGYVYTPIQAILDYILSYTVFGITGFLSKNDKKEMFILTYLMAAIMRFIFTSISGYVFFAEYAPESWNPIVYTIIYNGGYIFTEAIITCVFLSIPYIYKNIYKLRSKF